MDIKKLLPILAIPPLFTVVWFWIQQTNQIQFSYAELQSLRPPLQPLLNLIGSAQGNYNSINRGLPRDTPAGWAKENLGSGITKMSVRKVRSHQGGSAKSCWYEDIRGEADLYAVGRYQLIPCTFQLATKQIQNLDMDALFNKEMQDTIGVFLLIVKRPKIREYLVGFRTNHQHAGQELAREFSSVPMQFSNGSCKKGQTFYCEKNKNQPLLDITTVDYGLKDARTAVQKDGTLSNLLSEKENVQTKIHRWWKHMTEGRK